MVKKLRDEKKFSSIQELSEQIKKDIKIAKEILEKNGYSKNLNIS